MWYAYKCLQEPEGAAAARGGCLPAAVRCRKSKGDERLSVLRERPPCGRLAFAVDFPLGSALARELGEQLVAAGLPGAALALFEAERLWEPALLCLRLLGKSAQALALVRARLAVRALSWARAVCGVSPCWAQALIPTPCCSACIC